MKTQKPNSTWQLFLIGIPFAALSLVALGLAVWQIAHHVRAMAWVEHPAVLQSLGSVDAPTLHMRIRDTSRLEGSYRYAVDGREYVGTRIAFSWVHAYGLDDWDDEIAEALGEPGAEIDIWINPDNPAESVAVRDMRWGEFGAYLLFAFGMGCGGVFFLSAAFSRGEAAPKQIAKVPRVKLRTVIIMWLLAPGFAALSWLLWRDGHPVWAVIAGLQLLLTVNASYQYARRRNVNAR